MSRPNFAKEWASSRLAIPTISDQDYALGLAAYLGSQPPTTDDHDYIFNLQDKRAVWLGEQMLLAVGHEWQDDVTYDAYAIVRSPVDGQLYRSLVGGNLGNEPSVSGAQWALGVQPLSVDFLNTTRIDVASSATVNLTSSAPNTRHINITGTTAIMGFTVEAGQCYFVRFAGALTLTNSASLVTQTGANIVTAAGDTCIIRATAANVVEVLCYKTWAMPKSECTAWVNFNGTGTVAIRDSYNVSSITDNGVGLYTINFATSMANANYAFALGSDNSGDNLPNLKAISTNPPTASALPIRTTDNSNAARDFGVLSVIVFGGK